MNILEQYDLSKDSIGKFEIYFSMLTEWNKKFNLTAILEQNEVYEKHFIDSLMSEKYVNFSSKSLLDVGSGAGFPGIPLAINHPDLSVTLLESNGKKITFLNEVIKKLDLKNVKIIQGRSEEITGEYDFVTARAVKQLNILLEISSHLIKVGGNFLAYKGNADNEINQSKKALEKLNLEIIAEYKYELPVSKDNRELIVIRKLAKTPNKYPRNYSDIVKKPL